ncbi:MAG: DUF1801 domain-containing protein [Bacteroidia bacterium]
MAEIKTKKTNQSSEAFLKTIKDKTQQEDSFAIIELMKKASKSEPRMWGSAIIGFGDYSYKTADGKDNDWFMIGFSPRKGKFSLYLLGEKGDKFNALLGKLGKHKRSTGCLYVNRLADVDTKVLQELFETQVEVCSGK